MDSAYFFKIIFIVLLVNRVLLNENFVNISQTITYNGCFQYRNQL